MRRTDTRSSPSTRTRKGYIQHTLSKPTFVPAAWRGRTVSKLGLCPFDSLRWRTVHLACARSRNKSASADYSGEDRPCRLARRERALPRQPSAPADSPEGRTSSRRASTGSTSRSRTACPILPRAPAGDHHCGPVRPLSDDPRANPTVEANLHQSRLHSRRRGTRPSE